MSWNHDGRRNAPRAQVVLHDGAQRRTMQMIEMRMGDQHHVDGRKVGNAQSGTTQALQHKKPACEVGIDDNALAANLHEKAGVADEGDAKFAIRGEPRLVSLTGAGSHCRAAHETPDLGGALAGGRIGSSLYHSY